MVKKATKQEEMVEEVTEKEGKGGNNLELPYGYVDKDGNLHKEFEIREMTGADEEEIAQGSIRNNAGKIITTILGNCVTRIGDFKQQTTEDEFWNKIMKHLYIGDRNYILLKLRELTYNGEIEFEDRCPTCGEDLNVYLKTDEVEIIEPPKDPSHIEFELPKGCKHDGGTHKKGYFELPKGGDQEILHKVAQKNLGKANTTLMFKTVRQLGDAPLSSRTFRNLGKMDREHLTEKIGDNRFGPDFEVEVVCETCGDEIIIGINPVNFI